ncbi:MAG: NADH-quinone oxidoreductase subunit [Chloroflexota bacterium]|jgi:NADH-quinone oxidoreductase subunit N|nr:NADH-quinone oxidoreductase subunit [Chloroflexota bacterium]
MISVDAHTILALLPPVGVALLALIVVVVDMYRPGRDRLLVGIAVGGLALLMALVVVIGPLPGLGLLTGAQEVFDGAYVRDSLTALVDLLLMAIALLTILFGPDYLRPRGLPAAEFAAMLLFAITGGMLIAGAHDLIVLFLALELLVLPGYLLAGYAKRDGLSTEGAIKYFLLGSFSSAIFLFGLVLTFGYIGTTNIGEIASSISATLGANGFKSLSPALLMGLALLTTGAAFKIAAVPFHYWTPDAYQGSPTPVTGYLSVGPKVAAFALILRLFVDALGGLKADWTPFIVVLAALTMTLGNLVAVGQDNIKRMLAYSSIAHTGYILVGLAAFGAAPVGSLAEQAGLQAVLFYSVAYSFMNLGAFAVVAALQRRPGVTSQLATFAGLGRRAPLLAALMLLFLLSLTGIPPLAGFWAKWYVIQSALQVGGWLTLLAVLTVLNAAAAAFYYLRVAVYMYMREPADSAPAVELGGQTRIGLGLAALGTVAIGLVPPVTIAVITMAQQAAQALL